MDTNVTVLSGRSTKEMRDKAKELHIDAISPQLVIERDRLFLEQSTYGGGKVKIDATGLYLFLKEMFTTEWEIKK